MIREIAGRGAWNGFLLRQNPNTFLQSWEWGQVQIQDGEETVRLGMFEGERQIGAMQLIIVRARRGTFILCPHGPVFESEELAREHLPEFVAHARALGKNRGAAAVRIAPLLKESPEHTELFASLGFRPAPLHIHAERTWVLDISGSEKDILAGMRKTTRHAIRKAGREHVTVEISDAAGGLARFWPLYQATQTRHQFTPFSKQFLEYQVQSFLERGLMYFVFAAHREKDVAAAVMMQFGTTVFYYHGASAHIPRGVPAAQLLHWESIREAKRRGATRYNFWGIAPEGHGPEHPFAGITVFKQGFGGTAIPYVHLQDLPLTPEYWKLWAVERWRKYRRGF